MHTDMLGSLYTQYLLHISANHVAILGGCNTKEGYIKKTLNMLN
jgi:hypothetical protein